MFVRALVDESGQDVIEYALLGAVLGLAGAAALNLILTNMGASYATWDTNVQDLWELPAPSGS